VEILATGLPFEVFGVEILATRFQTSTYIAFCGFRFLSTTIRPSLLAISKKLL